MVKEPFLLEQRGKRPALVTLLACGWAVTTFVALGETELIDREGASWWGLYHPFAVYDGAWWSLVTSAFIHINFFHLVFNLYWIWLLGSIFERRLGSLATAAFIVASAFVSSGCEMFSGVFGVGLSGVAYALFGFGWAARSVETVFAKALDRRVISILLIWGALGVVLTYSGVLRVGNVAHFTGMVFGLLLGASWSRPRNRIPVAVGAALMTALAIVPLYWSPLSADWVSYEADQATKAQQWDKAAALLYRSLELGQDPAWAWEGLASIYGYQQKKPEYRDAMQVLRMHSPDAADRVEAEYGKP